MRYRRRPTCGAWRVAALALWLMLWVPSATAQDSRELAALSEALESLTGTVGPAVVQVFATAYSAGQGVLPPGAALLSQQRGSGSGVIVDPSGYIVTNGHIVADAVRVQVELALPDELTAGRRSIVAPSRRLVGAQVVGIDAETDLAVLKVQPGRPLPFLELGDSDELKPGQLVMAFGSPRRLENSVSLGVVSAVARQIRPDHPMIYIQTDAAINPGNSGGPLVDVKGQIVGISTFIISQSGGSEGIGFAAPSNIVRTVYQQILEHGRVVRGEIGVRAQTITRELDGSDVITSGYVQDHWQVNSRLALDLGLRYDYDAMLGESHLSPRTAFSLKLDAGGQRLIKGGWGIFFDQVRLQVDAFDGFQRRIEQDFNGTEAAPAGPPVVFENRVDPEGLEEPLSRVWNIEFDQQLGESLLFRVNYRENHARDRLVIDRVTDGAGSALVLSSTGRLTGREFDATVRWTLANRGDLFVSFSKIRTRADLNDFGLIYDNLRDPLVFENESALQPFEAPNRVLLWGVITLPKGFTLTPGIEWRSGFPYTVFTEDYTVVGQRNRADFPRFLSADVAVTKRLSLFGRRVDIGVQAYNLTSHDNPRDVVSNLASPSFGEFRNTVGSTISLKLGLGL